MARGKFLGVQKPDPVRFKWGFGKGRLKGKFCEMGQPQLASNSVIQRVKDVALQGAIFTQKQTDFHILRRNHHKNAGVSSHAEAP